ncbi:putative aquaporin [Cladorrhinum samala]|uniref:Aquaporin n=1 Tax=Cladorrhinum samala TaxID=585594 RepID=A0AAV9HWV2_9PEZI|nr:putative aquaporin [Cladorrhinum samala]
MPQHRMFSFQSTKMDPGSSSANANGNNNNNNNDGSDRPVRPGAGFRMNSLAGALPMLTRPSNMRNNLTAFIGEFVGTFLFLFFSFGGTQIATSIPTTQFLPGANSKSPVADSSNLMFISLCFGLSLMANVWAFYRVTGGLFNPSVTLALFLVGGLPAVRSVIVVAAQLLGGIAAAGVVSALFPGPMGVETTLGGGASVVQGLFIEMFLTAELVFVIIMLAAEKHRSTHLAPVGIGIAFFLAELVGVYFTGGSLNFARSLGPAVVNRSFPGYFWIYFVGPLLGSLLASGFYAVLKYLRWKECNPGQDSDDLEKFQQQQQQRTFSHHEKNASHDYDDGHASHASQANVSEAGVSPGAHGQVPVVPASHV